MNDDPILWKNESGNLAITKDGGRGLFVHLLGTEYWLNFEEGVGLASALAGWVFAMCRDGDDHSSDG